MKESKTKSTAFCFVLFFLPRLICQLLPNFEWLKYVRKSEVFVLEFFFGFFIIIISSSSRIVLIYTCVWLGGLLSSLPESSTCCARRAALASCRMWAIRSSVTALSSVLVATDDPPVSFPRK